MIPPSPSTPWTHCPSFCPQLQLQIYRPVIGSSSSSPGSEPPSFCFPRRTWAIYRAGAVAARWTWSRRAVSFIAAFLRAHFGLLSFPIRQGLSTFPNPLVWQSTGQNHQSIFPPGKPRLQEQSMARFPFWRPRASLSAASPLPCLWITWWCLPSRGRRRAHVLRPGRPETPSCSWTSSSSCRRLFLFHYTTSQSNHLYFWATPFYLSNTTLSTGQSTPGAPSHALS